MSVLLYQMPHSPYAIPIRQALVACRVAHGIREVPNWDRSEIIRLTEGRYYQVPLLVHDGRVVFESGPDSLDVARYVDAAWAGGRLFPEALCAANLCLTQWIEDALEAHTFKLADIHYIPGIDDLVARSMVVRHKERKFGRGCLESWTREAAQIRASLDRLLLPFCTTLNEAPHLLGSTPVYADFALFGVLENLTFNAWNQFSQEQAALQDFVHRLRAWRFA